MDAKSGYAKKDFEVFLQGSYGNDSNIYGESDVDVRDRLDSTFRGDVSDLPAEQQAAYHQAFPKATYTFADFKKAVVIRLSNVFGAGTFPPKTKPSK